MRHFDVVIVGGGPSGSSLAFLLQKQGISSCIIDKAKFPRDKLCGGLLTEKTADVIQRIYGDINFPYERISSSVSIFFEAQKLSNIVTQSRFFLVNRRDFDGYLFKRYIDIGGIAFEKETIKSVEQSKQIIETQSGMAIHYSVLVGADGANSFIRKLIDPEYKPNAVCVETSISTGITTDEICVFFTDSRSGYGWSFPKSDYYTVGMGGDVKWNRQIREDFTRFCEKIGMPVEKQKIRGAMIPFGEYVKHPYSNDVLLVGDAAGLVDPITGEGVYFALRSSELASTAIIKRLNNKTPFEETYGKKIKEIQQIIEDANCFNRTYFSYPIKKRLLPLLYERHNMLNYYCENLLARYNTSYMAFPTKYLVTKLKRKLKAR